MRRLISRVGRLFPDLELLMLMAYQNDGLDELILMIQVWSDLANENQFFDQKCNFNIKQANILKKRQSPYLKRLGSGPN